MKSQLKVYFILTIVLNYYGCTTRDEIKIDPTINIDSQVSHDLNLPDWGPYTKKYVGISHIPMAEDGLRFDLRVFPTIFNEKTSPPNVLKRGNFFIWEASPDLKYFSYRHELKWKDQLYADISYSYVDENSRLIAMNLVNNTDSEQVIGMHMMSSLHFPPLEPHKPDNEILIKKIELPEHAVWKDALAYKTYIYRNPGHRNELNYDGKLRGELRENGLINGNAIEFAHHTGDKVSYEYEIPNHFEHPILYVRYKTIGENDTKIKISGSIDNTFQLEHTSQYRFAKIDINRKIGKKIVFELEAISGSKILIDGFAIVNEDDIEKVKTSNVVWNPVPEIIENLEEPQSLILKYENTEVYYGLYWDNPNTKIRDFTNKNLPEDFNLETGNENYSKPQNEEPQAGFYKDVQVSPIKLSPNTTKTLHAFVCSGDLEQVRRKLLKIKTLDFNEIHQDARKHLHEYNIIQEGEKYLFSQKRMAAVTLSNIVYPIYTQNQYIRHSAPGRKWDCLYTWDSGFIGIGLNQFDSQRSIENLNAYLNFPEEQSAFIDHGTLLPVQFYQFLEIWNKTQSQKFLEETYPKLKYYYNFLSGKTETSTTNNLESGLIRTWDYFYNSGGWDDYPAQKYIHGCNLTKRATPVISTAHLIRIAKIMKLASRHLQLRKDYDAFQQDINIWANALDKYSWDEQSGYYSYVIHDNSGWPIEKLKFKDSINFNMGLDGVSPIISGISNEQQIQKMMANLTAKGKIWSDIGLSTVDQSAPYYDKDGYWNGHVWMPHQWFIWKAMLDLNESDFAHQIAETALNLWKKETEETYSCYEYFSVETERGKGWYQFGGLSTPVLSWFTSYYEIGTFTSGLDTWIVEKSFNDNFSEFTAMLRVLDVNNKPFTAILCLNPKFSYDVYWNDEKVPSKELNKGTLSISLKRNNELGKIRVVKKR